MSHLHHWKTLLGIRLALKWRCCPDCVHLVQTALLSFWIERRAAGSAPLGFLQEAVLCTPGCSILQGFSVPVWCLVLRTQTQELVGPFSSRPSTLCHCLWYLIICLATKVSFTEGCCEILWHKIPAWSAQLCANPALHPAARPRSLPAKAWPFVWGACRSGGCLGRLNSLIKTILELWADEHFGSCSPSPLMISVIPYGQLWHSQCCSSALCCNHHAEPWLI